MRTVCLRPNAMYGEGDKHYILNMLRTAKMNGGVLPTFGDPNALFQQVQTVCKKKICIKEMSFIDLFKKYSLSAR